MQIDFAYTSNLRRLRVSALLDHPTELGSVDLQAIQDDSKFTGERELGDASLPNQHLLNKRARLTSSIRICCPKQPQSSVRHDPNDAARNYARSLADTPKFEQSANERKKVEMRFGHLKTHQGFDLILLRELSGASYEFHLAAVAPNLKKMALKADEAAHSSRHLRGNVKKEQSTRASDKQM